MHLHRNIRLEREFEVNARYLINVNSNFSCDAEVFMDGTPAENMTNRVELIAGTIDLQRGCSLRGMESSDIIRIRPSCSGDDCTMFLGEHSTRADVFHLEDEELDRVMTIGSLFIGDFNGSEHVDYIRVRGMSYDSADIRTYMTANAKIVNKVPSTIISFDLN